MNATGCTNVSRPRRNRVTPLGDIEVTAYRGTLMGNRGDLHAPDGTLGLKWRIRRWITCALDEIGGKRITFDTPGLYYPLFFADEAVSLAAGHRPCAYCRRNAYDRFIAYWKMAHSVPSDTFVSAREVDQALHQARIRRGCQVTYQALIDDLPDGAFLMHPECPGQPFLLWKGDLHPWSHQGYGEPQRARYNSQVSVLTPLPLIRTIAAGYSVDPGLILLQSRSR